LSAHSSSAKSILPRIAATLDLPQVSDITSLSHSPSTNETTFTRPIYAGNAIETVKAGSDIPLKIITVRGTAFPALPSTTSDSSSNVSVEELPAVEGNVSLTTHLSTELTTSDRPDLGTAKTIVSGGRALKNKETFNSTLDPLAQVLNAALGASRAAVDAGYADNSLQIGQTGKIVAPELYIAIGISGAIQHLAGMKDSKMIVAVNKVRIPFLQISSPLTFQIGRRRTHLPSSRRRHRRRLIRNCPSARRKAQAISPLAYILSYGVTHTRDE
jgi:electron transfer flavoprotein alpha subunit